MGEQQGARDSRAEFRERADLCVLASSVEKVARGDRLLDAGVVAPGADQVELVAVHDADQLLAGILCRLEGTDLDEVLVAPGVRELGLLRRVAAGFRLGMGGREIHGPCRTRGPAHAVELPRALAFHPLYTASRVRWSPSGWKNLALLWSACACFSLGR